MKWELPTRHRNYRIIAVVLSSFLIIGGVFSLWSTFYQWGAPCLILGVILRLWAYFYPDQKIDKWFKKTG